MKKPLLLFTAALLAMCATVPPAAAGGNPLCPPGKVCSAK
jgi:starvation-inducible outer membrane lipoprotein